MVLSALFFIDLKGKVLISRNYRGDVSRAQAERFAQKVQETDPTELKPVFVDAGVSYVYLQVSWRRAITVATCLRRLIRPHRPAAQQCVRACTDAAK